MAEEVQLVVKHSDYGDTTLCYTSGDEHGVDVVLSGDLVDRCTVLRNILDHEHGTVSLPITTSAFECWLTGSGTLIEHCQACNVRALTNDPDISFSTISSLQSGLTSFPATSNVEMRLVRYVHVIRAVRWLLCMTMLCFWAHLSLLWVMKVHAV